MCPMLASVAPKSNSVVGRVPDLESGYLGSDSSWPLLPSARWGQQDLSDLLLASPYEATYEAIQYGAGMTRRFIFS